MFISKKQIEKTANESKKSEVLYNSPEILMIDCEKVESDKLIEKGFNIEIGTFGKIYKIDNQQEYKKARMNHDVDNIIEKDIIIVNMKQNKTCEIYDLEKIRDLEDGAYVTNFEKQKEFNPINLASSFYKNDFLKLKDKDSIIIIFADREVIEKYNVAYVEDRYFRTNSEKLSNYNFIPFNINPSHSDFETKKYKILESNIFKDIFKNYKGQIYGKCTFTINPYEKNNTVRLLENIYGDLIGYFQLFEKQDGKIRNTLIVLPQCENISILIENIITEILPVFYPEMCKDFVKDLWVNDEGYMLPEIKKAIEEKIKINEEYEKKLNEVDQRIKQMQEKNAYLYNIIRFTGTGEKLVENIIKCLEYIGYPKVEDWDKIREDGEKEEDIHIYKNDEEFFIAEVKGVNGPAIEDDCNVIVKYKSRNCSKLKIPSIHGIVFVNYHKNVEPNRREELGFTQKEIKDAIRDEYTLVGTYELFKAIRMCQENIISKENIRKTLETPGIFRSIPTSFVQIGKIDNILDKINVICIPLECNKIKINDELLIIEDNNYYKTKILSLMVDEKNVEESNRGEKVGIKINKNVPKVKSSQIYLIK